MYSLSLLFCQTSLNTVSSTVHLSSFEVCLVLSFTPHPIFLFPVICFELPVTRTHFSISLEGSSYRESPVVYLWPGKGGGGGGTVIYGLYRYVLL